VELDPKRVPEDALGLSLTKKRVGQHCWVDFAKKFSRQRSLNGVVTRV